MAQSYPTSPGCYIHKDAKGVILYIGKAKNLKNRIANYVDKPEHTEKTKQLISQIVSTEVIVTNTEKEALILENNLIKKHQPKYNINLKDDKRYAYLKLTKEAFPRLVLARKKTDDGMYFGPFVSGDSRNYIMNLVTKIFKLRTCKKFPKKACLRYHINICSAPCVQKVDELQYAEQVDDAKDVLKGRTKEIVAKLKQEMKSYSTNLAFEQALERRRQIESLEYLEDKQSMERKRTYEEDIINYIVKNGEMYLVLFNVRKGMLENKQEFIFSHSEDSFEEFLVQYYSENKPPKEVILPKKVDESLQEFLEDKRGTKVVINIPKIGEKKNLLTLVKKNIESTFFGEEEKVYALQEALELMITPRRIECFDVSHLSGTHTVASMVSFKNGKPDKSNYRKFKIKTVEGIDDFRSMAEVVHRRYKRLIKEGLPMPDLIVIDGGKGQLSMAKRELEKLAVNIPIIGLAKREEEIFFPGSSMPLLLGKKHKGLQLLMAIRDEAHRFAITFNRSLRVRSQE